MWRSTKRGHEKWEEKKEALDNSFSAVLGRSSDVFQTWRYIYEGGREGEVMIYQYEFCCLSLAGKAIRNYFGPVSSNTQRIVRKSIGDNNDS